MTSRLLLLLCSAAAAVACAPERDSAGNGLTANAEAPAAASNAPDAAPAAPAAPVAPSDRLLTLAGLGPIRIGEPPAADGALALAEDEVQISFDCRTLRSPDLPGVYAMSDGKRITRITLMRDSPAVTERGIGLGATEAEVRSTYPDLTESPHEYVDAPAKNLVWQPAASGLGLRFEIGSDGRVSLIHAGLPPWLGNSEGCA